MKKWQLQSEIEVDNQDLLLKVLLKNRDIKASEAKNFLKPKHPRHWQLADLDFNRRHFNQIKKRLK